MKALDQLFKCGICHKPFNLARSLSKHVDLYHSQIEPKISQKMPQNEIRKRKIAPTKLLPLWDLLGVTLGFGTAMLGKKATMLCTASVEEVIGDHYKNQTYELHEDEKELKKNIIRFRDDELNHKDIAYDGGASKEGLYGLLDKVIKTSSRIAIKISKKI